MNSEIHDVRALLVEDDKIASFIGEELLTQTGFIVDCVSTAEQAIKLYKEEPYKIIFMDIELPGMSGSLATREIRSIEKIDKLPTSLIFALTAHTDQSYRDHCYQMGVTEIIEKPLDEKKIGMAMHMLSELLRENKSNPRFTESTGELIDIKELMKLTNNDTHKVLLLISEFLNFLKKMEVELEDEINKKDKKRFIHLIHSLAATASYIHAPHLCKLTKRIEDEDSQISLQELMPIYSQIMGEIHRIQRVKFDERLIERNE